MQSDALSPIFFALADPTRRAILESLTKGPLPMGEIAKPFPISGPGISKHLRVLERAGLIKTDKRAQQRPRSLDAKGLEEAHAYIQTYRQFWEESFDRLDALLTEMQSKDPQP